MKSETVVVLLALGTTIALSGLARVTKMNSRAGGDGCGGYQHDGLVVSEGFESGDTRGGGAGGHDKGNGIS